jgi:hypothetical protein
VHTAAAMAGVAGISGAVLFLALVATVVLWCVPLIIAALYNLPRKGPIAVLSLALGWTGVAWLAALVIVVVGAIQAGEPPLVVPWPGPRGGGAGGRGCSVLASPPHRTIPSTPPHRRILGPRRAAPMPAPGSEGRRAHPQAVRVNSTLVTRGASLSRTGIHRWRGTDAVGQRGKATLPMGERP